MILRPAVPGSLLKMQIHRSHPRPFNPNLPFSKAPGTVVTTEASFTSHWELPPRNPQTLDAVHMLQVSDMKYLGCGICIGIITLELSSEAN